jgi:hypothetical protein
MKQFYEEVNWDWENHDWCSLISSRLYDYILDESADINRMLGLEEKHFTAEEWLRVKPILETLHKLQLLNEVFPYDQLRLEDYHLKDDEMVYRWLQKATDAGAIQAHERDALIKKLHQTLGF